MDVVKVPTPTLPSEDGPTSRASVAHKLVGAAAGRVQLHKRALSLLASLQDELQEFLSDLFGPDPGQPGEAHGVQRPSLVDSLQSQHNLAASAHALGVTLPTQQATNALLLATQQRTDLVRRTCLNFDDLFTNIEGFLADLVNAASKQQNAAAAGEAADDEAGLQLKLIPGDGRDIMREAAATYAAAQRWQQRAADAQQAAMHAQKMAWQKATEAAALSSQATEAQTQAEILRLQGNLPEAMMAIRSAGKLRAAAEEAMRESEAYQMEHKARLEEAAEASRQALDISKHAQQLELAGLQQEADAAMDHAMRCRNQHTSLLQQAQQAQASADTDAAEAKQLERRIFDLQAASIRAYADGDLVEGQRLHAEAAALQPLAEAAAARSAKAAERAAALHAEAQQLEAEVGMATDQAGEFLQSKERLQGVAAQRHAQRLLDQAQQAMAAAQQGYAEADALDALDRTYQNNRAEALRQAEQLERDGKPELAAVQRAAAESWGNLSKLMNERAVAARAQATRKAEIGGLLQRAAQLAASGIACDNADNDVAAEEALAELMDPVRQRAVAAEAIRELLSISTPDSDTTWQNDPEMLHAATEEAQQRAARLNQQLHLTAEYINAQSRPGSGPSRPGPARDIRTIPQAREAALDNVALTHMAHVVKLGRLAKAWQDQANTSREAAVALKAEAEMLEAQAAHHEQAAHDLEGQAQAAEQAGDMARAQDIRSAATRERETAAGLRAQAEAVRLRAAAAVEDAMGAGRHAAALANSILTLDNAAWVFQQAAAGNTCGDAGWEGAGSPASNGRTSAGSSPLPGMPSPLSGTLLDQMGRRVTGAIARATGVDVSAGDAGQGGTQQPLLLLPPGGEQINMSPPGQSRPDMVVDGQGSMASNQATRPTTGPQQPGAQNMFTCASLDQWNQEQEPQRGTAPGRSGGRHARHSHRSTSRAGPNAPSIAQTLANQLKQAAADQARLDLEADDAHGADVPLPQISRKRDQGKGSHGRGVAMAGGGASPGQDLYAALRSALNGMTVGERLSQLRARDGLGGSGGLGGADMAQVLALEGTTDGGDREGEGGDKSRPLGALVTRWLDAGVEDGQGGVKGRAGSRSAARKGLMSSKSVGEFQPGLERPMAAISAHMQGTAMAVEELQQDAAAAADALAAAEQEASEAAAVAARGQQQVDEKLAAGVALTEEDVRLNKLLQLAAQRAVLMRDMRAHDAQAISKQLELMQQKLKHLQTANACLADVEPTTAAAMNAEQHVRATWAKHHELRDKARELERQAADARMQAEAARQQHAQLSSSGHGLEAASMLLSAQQLEAKAEELSAQAAKIRCASLRAAKEARHTQVQADTLNQLVNHVEAMSDLEHHLAGAVSHEAQLLFLHAYLLSLATELQAEATSLRLQEAQTELAGQQPDRVHTLAQPRLQERSRALLAASSQMWELIQDALVQDAPVLSQLVSNLSQLMTAEEAIAMRPLVLSTADEAHAYQDGRTDPDDDLGTVELRQLVRHGKKVVEMVVRSRDLRQQLAEALVLERAGRSRTASVVRSRSLFSDVNSGASGNSTAPAGDAERDAEQGQDAAAHQVVPVLQIRDPQEVGPEYNLVSSVLHIVEQAQEVLLSNHQLGAAVGGLSRSIAQQSRKAVMLRQRVRELAESCRPYGEGVQACGAWAQALHARQQLSQARAASNATGILVAQVEGSMRAAAEAEQEANESDKHVQQLQGLLSAVKQAMHKCTQLAGVLDEEAELRFQLENQMRQQKASGDEPAVDGDAVVPADAQVLRLRLQALGPCRVHLAGGLEASRQLCVALEALLNQDDESASKEDLVSKVHAAQAAVDLHETHWRACAKVMQMLDAYDRYSCQASQCCERVASFQVDGRELQGLAAEAQLAVLRQRSGLQALEGTAQRLRVEADQVDQQVEAMQKVSTPRLAVTGRASQRLLSRQVKVYQELDAARQQMQQAGAQLVAAQCEADSTAWHADAAALRQAVCAQCGPVLDGLARKHLEVAQAELAAVELSDKVKWARTTEPGGRPQSSISSSVVAVGSHLQALLDQQAAAEQVASDATASLTHYTQRHAVQLDLLEWAVALRKESDTFVERRDAWRKLVKQQQTGKHPDQADVSAARRAYEDAGHQLHVAVEQARAAITLPPTQEQVERLAQHVAELEALSQLSGRDQSDLSPQLVIAQAALARAEAMLGYQQAQAQLALTGTFEHLLREAEDTHERVGTRAERLQLEAEAARAQVAHCQSNVGQALSMGQLQDGIAFGFAGLAATQRETELQRELRGEQSAATAARHAHQHLRSMETYTDELRGVLHSVNCFLHNNNAPETSAPANLNVLAEVCANSEAATRLRLTAATGLMGGVRHAERLRVASANLKSCTGELSALKQALQYMVQQGNQQCACLLEEALQEARSAVEAARKEYKPPEGVLLTRTHLKQAADKHDLAMINHKLLHLEIDKHLLQSQVLQPAQARLAGGVSSVATLKTFVDQAAAAVALANQNIDACQAALQAAPPEHRPVYETRFAALQPRLAEATDSLLAAQREHKAACDAQQLQIMHHDLAQAALGVQETCLQLLQQAIALPPSSPLEHDQHTQDVNESDSVNQGVVDPHNVLPSHMQLALKHVVTIEGLSNSLGLDVPTLDKALSGVQGRAGEDLLQALDRVRLQQHGTDALGLAAQYAKHLLETASALQQARQRVVDASTPEAMNRELAPELRQAAQDMVDLLEGRLERLEDVVRRLYDQARWALAAYQSSSSDGIKPTQTERARMASALEVLRVMTPEYLASCDQAEEAARQLMQDVEGAQQAARDGASSDGLRGADSGVIGLAARRAKALHLASQSKSKWDELQLALDLAALYEPPAEPIALENDPPDNLLADLPEAPLALPEPELSVLPEEPSVSRRSTVDGAARSRASTPALSMSGVGGAGQEAEDGQEERKSEMGRASPSGSLASVGPEVSAVDTASLRPSGNGLPWLGDDEGEGLRGGLQGLGLVGEGLGVDDEEEKGAKGGETQGTLPALPHGTLGPEGRRTAERILQGLDELGRDLKGQEEAGGKLTDMASDGSSGGGGGGGGGAGLGDGLVTSLPNTPRGQGRDSGAMGWGLHGRTGTGNNPQYMGDMDKHGTSLQQPQRQPLPANLTAEQAQLLLGTWRRRLQVTQQASHLAGQLQQLAQHQVDDRQRDLNRPEASGRAEVGLTAGSDATVRAIKQQLQLAQSRLIQLNEELRELLQDEDQAGGMVERLQLYAGAGRGTSLNLFTMAPQGSTYLTNNTVHARPGLLSPGAAAAVHHTSLLSATAPSRSLPTAFPLVPDGHTLLTAQPDILPGGRTARPAPPVFLDGDRGAATDSEPWLIGTAVDRAAARMHAATFPLMQIPRPDPGVELAQSILRSTGMALHGVHGRVDGGMDWSKPLGVGQDTSSQPAKQRCILGPAHAAKWKTIRATVHEPEVVMQAQIAELRQQEATVGKDAQKQRLKADQAASMSGVSTETHSDPFLNLLASKQAQAHFASDPVMKELQAVARAQAERHGRAAEELSSRHIALCDTIQQLTIRHQHLLSDLSALDRAHTSLVTAAGTELSALRADKEAYEVLCQALLLAVEHTGSGYGAADTSVGPHCLPGVGMGARADVWGSLEGWELPHAAQQTLQVLRDTARSRAEAALGLRSSALEQGQRAGDAYRQAAQAVVGQLRTVAGVLDQQVSRLGVLHGEKVTEERQCGERAGQAARGAVHVSADGQMELGQRLSRAAAKWRKGAAKARGEALSAQQQQDLIRLRAARMREVADQLEMNGKECQQRLSLVLDMAMRDVLQGTRSMALAQSWPMAAPGAATAAAAAATIRQPQQPQPWTYSSPTGGIGIGTRQQMGQTTRPNAIFDTPTIHVPSTSRRGPMSPQVEDTVAKARAHAQEKLLSLRQALAERTAADAAARSAHASPNQGDDNESVGDVGKPSWLVRDMPEGPGEHMDRRSYNGTLRADHVTLPASARRKLEAEHRDLGASPWLTTQQLKKKAAKLGVVTDILPSAAAREDLNLGQKDKAKKVVANRTTLRALLHTRR